MGDGRTQDDQSKTPTAGLTERQKAAIDSLFENPPDKFEDHVATAMSLSHYFHEQLAKSFAPALNAYAKSLPHDTQSEKSAVGSEINAMLHAMKLTIREPRTGLPATLVADFQNAEHRDRSRFRLMVRDPKTRKAVKVSVHRDVPELELMEDPPRKEGFARRVMDERGSIKERE